MEEEVLSLRDRQFAIMRVNIHVTSLYLQSTLLDTSLDALTKSSCREASGSVTSSESPVMFASEEGPEARTNAELWELRENLAQELLNVLRRSTSKTLEANGLSMVGALLLCGCSI
jgi:restriction endonuclease Mrr